MPDPTTTAPPETDEDAPITAPATGKYQANAVQDDEYEGTDD
jgi:hypothetical protein